MSFFDSRFLSPRDLEATDSWLDSDIVDTDTIEDLNSVWSMLAVSFPELEGTASVATGTGEVEAGNPGTCSYGALVEIVSFYRSHRQRV